ncbi:hypothetical protein [Bosea sp. (in: a-proteobacteria)]|uniref:hypothetical protein n=1 Tax=Bosea sp. (in: a-proteobacteria) TaxID=1871050 RepID=UPI00273709D6|nr:hypothetical protein [Bosea sp. (in: a-proteobacteria)]MDP3408086.1 hypothetical protein [Bosea sp. (in: a-proteobacteria)]
MTRAVGAVRDWYGTTARDGDFRARLLAAAIEANGGRRNAMVDRIVEYQCTKTGRGTVMTSKGLRQGRGVHAKRRRRESQCRPVREYVHHRVGQVAAEFLGRGEPIPSARRVRQILRDREFPCGETAIRSGLRSIPEVGTPLIDRNRARLPRPCRDLIEAFEEVMPRSSVSHTSVSECLRKLFVRSANPSTQRSHWRRLDAALKVLEASRNIGISVRREGGTVFVGRGRAVPDNGYAWARENALRHYDLSLGIANGRAGLWSSPEGRMARDLVATAHDIGDRFVGEELGKLLDITDSRQLDRVEEDAYGMEWSARRGVYNAADMRAGAHDRRLFVKRAHDDIDSSIDLIADLYHSVGLPGLWRAAKSWPGLKVKARDPAAQRRIARIADRFAEIRCPCKTVEAERFALTVWLDTPEKLRKPDRPTVSDYIPIVPRLPKIRMPRVRPAQAHRWSSGLSIAAAHVMSEIRTELTPLRRVELVSRG